ncbi:tRNA adenosine(34) deaminase TadA [Variovorax sp. ZT4R33]|uniref:tRNA adenosine(34) deaminase TadA n=1 Tax=Variovorax sp. ZT4R33 TaxID=3443743 RepID=UPI003F4545D0
MSESLPQGPATDAYWMGLALAEARAAAAAGEVPVGAVLVKDGRLVATGRNAPVASHDPSAHAELSALRAGAAVLGNYRLDGCELFVTLEPCAMCAGAILHARLARVVYGAADPKTGAAGSVVDLFAEPQLNHRTVVERGVLADQCSEVLQSFFQARRTAARESAQPLRDDALRTAESRFLHMGVAEPFAPRYIDDLPSQHGWRLHYLEEGPRGPGPTVLCLHGPGQWSLGFRHLLGLSKVRWLAPDLIGFGRSDKPKRDAVHRWEWHRDVLLEWLEAQTGPTLLAPAAGAESLAALLMAAAPARFVGTRAVPDAGDGSMEAAWRAPFPDRGHEAALRAFGTAPPRSSGPDARQAAEWLAGAMGYFPP